MNFSENLKAARKEKTLSQEQLAELLDVSRQAVSKWELGEGYPEAEKLIQIAQILGVSLDDLLLDGKPAGSDTGSVTQANTVLPSDREILILSSDGSKLSAYNEFFIVQMGAFKSKKSPRYVIAGRIRSAGVWKGNDLLGWYADIESAQKEMDAINQAILNGDTSYRMQYFAKVKGRLNPKIIDEETAE